jgi:excisionase family DNA binding protein
VADSQLPPVLTAQQAAEYLGISPRELYILLKAGRIPAFKVGTEWRFDRAAIDHWAEELEP